jgi:hypothetical protein
LVRTHSVELDSKTFARRVLAGCAVSDAIAGRFEPLALWWASGGGDLPKEHAPAGDGWLALSSAMIRLRPWTAAERLKALAECVNEQGSGSRLDLVGYLEAMVSASIMEILPERSIDELDSGCIAALLESVSHLNAAETPALIGGLEAPNAARLARVTLRLCGALGWTPSQVWNTPAPEVDRLIALLELVNGWGDSEQPIGQPMGGLASHPDAVVIQIEDS